MWKKAVTARKTLVNIVPVSDKKRTTLEQAFRGSACATWQAGPNEFMMLHLAYDCCMESESRPWSGSPPCSSSKTAALQTWFKERADFAVVTANAGPTAMAFCFDGRSREARKVLLGHLQLFRWTYSESHAPCSCVFFAEVGRHCVRGEERDGGTPHLFQRETCKMQYAPCLCLSGKPRDMLLDRGRAKGPIDDAG